MTMKRVCEETNDPLKRVRRVYSQFPLNLFRVGPSLTIRNAPISMANSAQVNCVNCNSNGILSHKVECYFCERLVCTECELNCIKCCKSFCSFCAVKTYASDSNNNGTCFSCR